MFKIAICDDEEIFIHTLLPIFYPQGGNYIDTLIAGSLYFPFVFPHPIQLLPKHQSSFLCAYFGSRCKIS